LSTENKSYLNKMKKVKVI